MRERVFIVFLLGFMLCAISNTLQTPAWYHIGGPHNIAIPSQTATPISIVGNTELSQRSTGGVGTRSDPYLLSKLSIITEGEYTISIQNTTAFFAISECDLRITTPMAPNIFFNNVENGLIEKCHIRGGSGGAYLSFCKDCTIKESTFIGCINGMAIRNSENCSIFDCKTYSNNVGIRIYVSDGSIVTNSSIYGNSDQGVVIGALSNGTMIYQNNIGWNGLNAFNDGNDTYFTDGVDIGNAWSDYNDSEVYEIQGFNPSVDPFATILTDAESPIIDSPLDMVFDMESNGETLTWSASDEFAYSYRLRINDVSQGFVLWDGREITISLDILPAGTNTLVMTVRDAVGNVASDEVIVTPISFMLGGMGTELVMWGSTITVVIFILVIIIIKKMP